MPRPSSVYVQRTLTYSCPNTNVCLEILEKVDEELSLEADLHVELKMDKLVFRVIGLEPNVQAAMAKLRDFLALYTSPKVDPRRGLSSEALAKYIRRAVPLDVLATVIRKSLGAAAEVRGPNLYANADLDAVLTIAKKVAEAQQKVEQLKLSSSLKKLLTAAIALYNVSHVEVLETLRSMQYLNEKNELTAPWTQVLEQLDEVFKA